MDTERSRSRLEGCYTTIPTMFRDDEDLSVDHVAIRQSAHHRSSNGPTQTRPQFLQAPSGQVLPKAVEPAIHFVGT